MGFRYPQISCIDQFSVYHYSELVHQYEIYHTRINSHTVGNRIISLGGFTIVIRYFLYYMLMAGVVWDSNPNGALRAIKELEKQQQIQHPK